MIINFLLTHFSIMYEIIAIFLLLGVIIFICGIMIARFDNLSRQDGVYFAFLTAFTVGLGDVIPKSAATRFITIILAFIGLILIGILVGVAVHALEISLNMQ